MGGASGMNGGVGVGEKPFGKWEMEECKYGSWWYVAPHWKAGSCNEDEVAN